MQKLKAPVRMLLMAVCIAVSGLACVQAQPLIPQPKEMTREAGRELRIRKVVQQVDTTLKTGYRLWTKGRTVCLSAATSQELVHAKATLAQLTGVGPDEFLMEDCFIGRKMPRVTVRDWSAFPIRGFMHDTGRNFREVEQIKQELDLLAFYKLNVFHWHLTDHPAWRIECRAYPQLNDPKHQHQGRDQGRFYTYDQIREVIAYAARRGITVIPEIDMPGHSQYFDRAFGFGMATPEGMNVLEACLKEFFEEIPAEDCPYIHIGSDEVHIENPGQFMAFCENLLQEHGRTPLAWYPGLPSSEQTISQIWSDEGRRASGKGFPRRYVDSYMGYLNLGNPLVNTAGFLLHQTAAVPEYDGKAMGAILCLWNDVRVDDKSKTFPHNGMPEGLLAFAQSSWGGGQGYGLDDPSLYPAPGTPAYDALTAFERKMSYHRDHYLNRWPVRWVANAHIPWQVKIRSTVGDENGTQRDTLISRKAWGGCVDLNALCRQAGVRPDDLSAKVTLTTEVYVERDTVLTAWVGFDSPSRSTRMSDGIGEQGHWENGGRLWVNRKEVFPQKDWEEPGAYRYHYQTWHQAPNEQPYTDEQFFWMREPVRLNLKKGWNSIRLECPRRFAASNWFAAFVPVTTHDRGRVSEATGITYPASAFSIVTSPAQATDASMNIGWATDTTLKQTTLEVTLLEDAHWRHSRHLTVNGTLCTTFDGVYSKTAAGEDFYEDVVFSKYSTTLQGLEPERDYQYRIITPTDTSLIHHFKTSGAQEWCAGIISDFHVYSPLYHRTEAAMEMIRTLEGHADLDWILHLGDITAWGGSYTFWRDLYQEAPFRNYLWAGVNGNHDNMTRGYIRTSNEFFRDAAAYPRNGYEGEEGVCYWFTYGDVLFVMLNNESMRHQQGLEAAQEWVRKVVNENPARYRVVCQHYQWFFGTDGTSSEYARWRDLFEELEIDLALAGNNHIYVRAQSGTVYIQTPSSDNERGQELVVNGPEPETLKANADKIAYRWSEGPNTVGAMYMQVSPEKMVLTLVDRTGKVIDRTEIPARASETAARVSESTER